MCESCGCATDRPKTLTKVRHVWRMCERCHRTMKRKGPSHLVFGAGVRNLPPPITMRSGWWAYRLAAQDMGYTLWHADTREKREALHRHWNRWMGAFAVVQAKAGTLPYRNTHEANQFLEEWEGRYGAVQMNPRAMGWVLEHCVRDEDQKHLTTNASRAILEAAAGIPRRGALSREERVTSYEEGQR